MSEHVVVAAIKHVVNSITKKDRIYFGATFSIFIVLFVAQQAVSAYSGQPVSPEKFWWQAASVVFLAVWLFLLLTLTALGKELQRNKNK